MKKSGDKKISQKALYVAIFTTVTVLLWIGFEVFRSLTTTDKEIEVTKAELVPLSRDLHVEVIDDLKKRLQIPQQVLDDIEGTGGVGERNIYVTEASDSATIETDTFEEATASGET